MKKDKAEKTQSEEETDAIPKSSILSRFGFVKGIIGFLLLVLIFGGAAFFVIRHENSSRVDDANKLIEAENGNTVEDCYTVPTTTPFTSGSPVWDQILVYALQHKDSNPEYAEFVDTYIKEGTLDSDTDVYKDIVSKVDKDEDSIRPFLQIGSDGELAIAEDTGDKYEAAMTEHPESMYRGGIYAVDIIIVTKEGDEEKTSKSTYIMGISQKPGENSIVFPIKKSDNSTVEQFEIERLLPVCE